MSDFGYFDDINNEYVITTPLTPRAWENRIWNNDLNIQVTNHGTGIIYERDHEGRFILYNWSNNRFLYVLDKTTGQLWSPCWYPVNTDLDSYECRHGLHYTEITGSKDGVEVSWKTTVHHHDATEIWQIDVKNTSGKEKDILLVPFYEIDISFKDPYWGVSNLFKGHYSPETNCLFVKNYSPKRDLERYALAYHSNLPIKKFELDSDKFKKRFSSYHNPFTVTADEFSNSMPDRKPPALSAGYNLDLPAGKNATLNIEIFSAESLEQAEKRARRYDGNDLYAEAKAEHRKINQKILAANCIKTGDDILDRFVNIWIKHQAHYNAEWNRGWQMGFRDAMQDCDSWRRHDPQLVRNRILQAAAHIYADGHTVRKWASIDDKLYFDGGIWFVNTIIMYIKETGDFSILNETVSYLDEGKDNILGHMKRTMDFLNNQRGRGGICRMGYGDWNDALNGIDRKGKGESVWTTMAYIWSLDSFVQLLQKLEDSDAFKYDKISQELEALLNNNYFEDDRYIRALTDSGMKVGSKENKEGNIYLNTQSWALISDVADDERGIKIVETVKNNLYTPWGPVLLYPAYTEHNDAIGRITSDPRGTVENGGNYVHASIFYCYGLARKGMSDEALKILHRILPSNLENPTENSKIEPYNITNCLEGIESDHPGRAMFAWRTGSAGWFLKVIWDGIFGIIPDYNGVQIKANLPEKWQDRPVTAMRNFRKMQVTFVFNSNEICDLTVENNSTIPYEDLKDGMRIRVTRNN